MRVWDEVISISHTLVCFSCSCHCVEGSGASSNALRRSLSHKHEHGLTAAQLPISTVLWFSRTIFLIQYWYRDQCFKTPEFTVLQWNPMKTAEIRAAACLYGISEGLVPLFFSFFFLSFLLSFFHSTTAGSYQANWCLNQSDMMWENKIITCQGFHLHKRQGVRSSFKTCRSSAHTVTPAWTLRNQLLLTLKTQHSSLFPVRPWFWQHQALLHG